MARLVGQADSPFLRGTPQDFGDRVARGRERQERAADQPNRHGSTDQVTLFVNGRRIDEDDPVSSVDDQVDAALGTTEHDYLEPDLVDPDDDIDLLGGLAVGGTNYAEGISENRAPGADHIYEDPTNIHPHHYDKHRR